MFYFHPYLRKWSNLTSIFQMGWNHQPDNITKKKRYPWIPHIQAVSTMCRILSNHRVSSEKFTCDGARLPRRSKDANVYFVGPDMESFRDAIAEVAEPCCHTTLMATRNPGSTHQLRLVVYPIIYKVLYIPGPRSQVVQPSTVPKGVNWKRSDF